MDQDILEAGAGAPPPEPAGLRLLRVLTTALLGVMIVGVITMVAVFVIRFPKPTVPLPDAISLPDGLRAQAVTLGPSWIAVVAGDEILIFSPDGTLKQRIAVQAD